MTDRRWLADEMLGRLARYLRFLGEDTAYAHGVDDDVVVAWAVRERRVLLTRDRALAARVDPSVLLDSVDVLGQLAEVYARYPELPRSTHPRRCTACNGDLEAVAPDAALRPEDAPVPSGVRDRFRCARCAHLYWSGSHAVSLDARLAARFG